MRGDAGVPLELNCGASQPGTLGSFQIAHSDTCDP
jgi:hypothetical protein